MKTVNNSIGVLQNSAIIVTLELSKQESEINVPKEIRKLIKRYKDLTEKSQPSR